MRCYDIKYLNSDVFLRSHRQNTEEIFDIPELGIRGNLETICRKLNKSIYRINEETNKRIQSIIKSLNLPELYAGIHIRRGDKVLETQSTPIDVYIDKLRDYTAIRDVYIGTDDYSIIEELKKYNNFHFYTLAEPLEIGYVQGKFDRLDKSKRYEAIIKILANVEILSKSEYCIGTLSSNVGMFLYLNMPKDYFVGVGYDTWRIW